MRQRVRFGAGITLLLILATLVIWQGSFRVDEYGPRTPEQTFVFWGLSTLIFLLTVLLAFMLFRDAVKLYFARRAGVEGSRIRTKILVGALSLTFLPTIFLVLWSYALLNRNLDKWFSRPGENIKLNLQEVGGALEKETRLRGEIVAHWVADSEQLQLFLEGGPTPAKYFASICERGRVNQVFVQRTDGGQFSICEANDGGEGKAAEEGREIKVELPVANGGGTVVVRTRMPLDLGAHQASIQREIANYDSLAAGRRDTRRFYVQLLVLITLFVLFVAVWVALFLARQVSAPVTALLDAARAVRLGDLGYRVRVNATDELASLVRAFNEMMQQLQTSRDELERRRLFIEAVLESIPSGVISLSHDGTIQLVNSALRRIFPDRPVAPGVRLIQLLPIDLQPEFARMLKRARRTGSADRQLELMTPQGQRHFSLTIASFEAGMGGNFVMVVEDTSELLHAQKAMAWHEVARRIAHELKNPLTPIGLSSERILRQLDKTGAPEEVRQIIRQCCATIGREVESVKNLVDEFSRFARFPAARPTPNDLNEVVQAGLAVFEGRMEGIRLEVTLGQHLPAVALDLEQFQRVVVNLVDNAAEAMAGSPLKVLTVETHALAGEAVELVITDTGCGVSREDKEKLFLPYFSTKDRGTGLGLAIVSHIVAEHHGQIRVEDNHPVGARFIIELPAVAQLEGEPKPA